MNKILFVLPSFLYLTVTGLIFAFTVRAESMRQSVRCEKTVARVVTGGDQNFREGNLLCPQDFVSPVQDKKPKILCQGSGRVLEGQAGQVSKLCAGGLNKAITRGGSDDSLNLTTRGAEVESKLIRPFGMTILQPRPDLSWEPTQGASEYVVRIDGHDFRHEQISSAARLSYPSSWPPLEYGNVYHIDIFAYQSDKIISTDRTTVNLVFAEDAIVINEVVAAIKQLSVPLSEVALELDALYMSYQLIDESIQLLEGLREQGESNPQLNQLLEKRYSQVGQSQLPTKTKFPQK